MSPSADAGRRSAVARLLPRAPARRSSRRRSAAASSRVVGLLVESIGPRAQRRRNLRAARAGGPPLPLEVVGFRDGRLLSVPLGDTAGIRPGDRIVARGGAAVDAGRRRRCSAASSTGSAGRSTASGRSTRRVARRCSRPPLNPLAREPIVAPIGTGVRAIDALLTCGRGQRIGLFGGSGVGKSTLLGMMARGTTADVVVLGAGRRARPRSAQLPRARSRPGGPRAVGRRRVDVRQPAAGAPARRLRRHGDRRVLPRPRARTCC